MCLLSIWRILHQCLTLMWVLGLFLQHEDVEGEKWQSTLQICRQKCRLFHWTVGISLPTGCAVSIPQAWRAAIASDRCILPALQKCCMFFSPWCQFTEKSFLSNHEFYLKTLAWNEDTYYVVTPSNTICFKQGLLYILLKNWINSLQSIFLLLKLMISCNVFYVYSFLGTAGVNPSCTQYKQCSFTWCF